jgi:hypothetical protein
MAGDGMLALAATYPAVAESRQRWRFRGQPPGCASAPDPPFSGASDPSSSTGSPNGSEW